MPREISAGAVICYRENGKVYYLLLRHESLKKNKRKKGHWDFPKGHLEKDETELEAAKREVAEETGLKDIEIISGFRNVIKYSFKARENFTREKEIIENTAKGGDWIFKVVVFFLARSNSKEVKLSHEHVGYVWLEYDEALKQLTFKNAKETLKRANKYLIEKGLQ